MPATSILRREVARKTRASGVRRADYSREIEYLGKMTNYLVSLSKMKMKLFKITAKGCIGAGVWKN
jgi:hypothetical protein